MTRLNGKAIFGAVAAASLLTVGCAGGPTPYQPLSPSSSISGGYSDQQISEDRYRVSFAGNTLTSREKVEAYLLFRAAELTRDNGYDWFAIVDRVVEHDVRQEVRPDPLYEPWYGTYYGYWRPSWRYYGPRGWRSWYPYYGHSFWTDHVRVREVEQWEAIAEIRVGRGQVPNGNMRAFDAAEVIARIGPRVEYPKGTY